MRLTEPFTHRAQTFTRAIDTHGRTIATSTTGLYHVILLSNFARAFDKYQRLYRKSAIPESTYPNEFYVLPEDQLEIGVAKASSLRERLQIPGDELLALETMLPPEAVHRNLRNGRGLVWPSPDLPVSRLYAVRPNGRLGEPIKLEEAMAKSLALHASTFAPYADLRPRSLSFLPIAKGCQAACAPSASPKPPPRPSRSRLCRIGKRSKDGSISPLSEALKERSSRAVESQRCCGERTSFGSSVPVAPVSTKSS